MSKRFHSKFALLAVFLMIVSSCGDDDVSPTTAVPPATEPPATAAPTTAAPTTAAPATAAPTTAAPTTAAPATTAAPTTPPAPVFEEGDRITVVIPYSPGGGVDRAARVIAPHLEDVLTAQTGIDIGVITLNVEGASGRLGVDTVSRADPDGLTIGVLLVSPMAGAQVTIGTPFDLAELSYFAQWEISDRAWTVRKDLELSERTVEALVRRSEDRSLLMGMAAGQADLLLLQALLEEVGLTLNVDLVEYAGTSEAALGLLRGDVDVLWGHNPAGMLPFVEDNPDDLEILATTACTRSLPDHPTIVDQGLPNADKICDAVGGTRRAFYGPPGMSQELIDTYRAALNEILNDPAVIAELAEARVNVLYQDGPEVAQAAVNLLGTYETFADILRQG